jgi:hypothetical protein
MPEEPTELCSDRDFNQIEAGIRRQFIYPSSGAKAFIDFLAKLRTGTGGTTTIVKDEALAKKVTELESTVSALQVELAELKLKLKE